MKKWIKAHSKILICSVGIIFIADAVYGFTRATESWHFIARSFSLFVWIIILLWENEVPRKINEWWDKD